jgi:integrase
MSSSKRKWRRRIGRVTAYQRGQRYWIYYRQGRQIRQPVGLDRDEAAALAAKVNAQLAEGAPAALAFQPINVGVLIDKWLDHHEQIRMSSVAAVRRYRTAVAHLRTYVRSTQGGLRVHRFDVSMAEDLVRYLRTSTAPTAHGYAGPSAIRRVTSSSSVRSIRSRCRTCSAP